VDGNAFRSWLATRRSIRKFRAAPVSEATLRALLESAVLAPSAHNRQPWRFAVVSAGPARERLAEAMAEKHRRDLLASGRDPASAEARVGSRRERLVQAPACIVLCLSMASMDAYPDGERAAGERAMAMQSAALAGGNLLLAAHAYQLGACWLCAPLFAPEAVRRALGLPDDWEPQAAIILGEPDTTPADPGRLPIDQVVVWR
jgi:F420 biosynthesis protein FbiB-like protein